MTQLTTAEPQHSEPHERSLPYNKQYSSTKPKLHNYSTVQGTEHKYNEITVRTDLEKMS